MNVKKAILLVEPDHEFRKTMGKTLEGLGYRVLAARDGHEALDILPNSAVDLIISALKMPNVDGKELLEEINRAKLSVPVIFLTAYGDIESYYVPDEQGRFRLPEQTGHGTRDSSCRRERARRAVRFICGNRQWMSGAGSYAFEVWPCGRM